jgi:molybdopterin/thiamine biosynthesis adenylyltransferase
LSRPALKASVPYFVADGAVHFRLSGVLTSLDDPDGRVLALIRLLDGQRTADVIWADLRTAYPDVTFEDVLDALDELDRGSLIHDATDLGPDFDAKSLERWGGNFGFFETYASMRISKFEFQRRIRDCKVAVLGIGGVGTHVLMDLAAIGFVDIRIVDFDAVELSNLNRQILYGEQFLGQPKVHVAAERARSFNGGVRLDVQQVRIRGADDVYGVVCDRDVVIGTADGPKLQMAHWLNEGCVRAGVPIILGGVDTQRALLYTIVPGLSGCVECWYDDVQRTDATTRLVHQDLRDVEARNEKFGEDTAAFDGLVALLGAHVIGETVRFASRVSPPLSVGRVLEMSFHDPQLRVIEQFKRLSSCRVCAPAEVAEAVRWVEASVHLAALG